MCLIKLVRLGIRSQYRISPFLLATSMHGRIQIREICTTSSSDNFQSITLSLLKRNLKKVDFSNEDFLHKKINNTDAYVDYDTTRDIPEDTCILRQYGDFTAMWTEVVDQSFKHGFLESIIFYQQASFDLFILFSPCKSLVSPPVCNLVRFSSAVLITFFRSLADGYCFYSAVSVRLVENNSLITLQNEALKLHVTQIVNK